MSYERKVLANRCIPAAWATPDPLLEAKALFALMKHDGLTVEQVKETIGVDDEEFADLNRWANEELTVAAALNGAMAYRQKVLDRFLLLVEAEDEPVKTRRKKHASRNTHNYERRSQRPSAMRL
ncbi:MAG: hypothetical protein WBE13_13710 [Candidatus Acidiferrum sp.]